MSGLVNCMVRLQALSRQPMPPRSAPDQRAERQLVAVVAADIAGYSRLMGADEEGTLARLKACRRDLIDPGVARHRGRIVKTTGDGLLIEFSIPVEAARLESLAEPGGICISGTMREQIRDRLALPFEDGGEQSVKNIARPIRVYSLSSNAIAALPKADIAEPPRSAARHTTRHYVAAAAL